MTFSLYGLTPKVNKTTYGHIKQVNWSIKFDFRFSNESIEVHSNNSNNNNSHTGWETVNTNLLSKPLAC